MGTVPEYEKADLVVFDFVTTLNDGLEASESVTERDKKHRNEGGNSGFREDDGNSVAKKIKTDNAMGQKRICYIQMEKLIWKVPLCRLGLFDVWEKFPIAFTHTHTDFKSVSTIDRILVNERLLSYIVDAGVLHLADNPSRHDPIMMKLDIGNIPVKVSSSEEIPSECVQ